MKKPFAEMKATGKLPSPSGVGMAILRMTRRDDFSTDDLVHTIQSDPALSGRILKIANAAATAGVEPAATISEAVMRLGARSVRNVALGFSLISNHREGTCEAFSFDTFWSESLARAVAGQEASKLTKGTDPSEAYICGLFSGVGRLALACVHADAYAELLERSATGSGEELAALEREAFEIDHLEVAVALFEDWGLPSSFGEALIQSSRLEAGNGDDDGPTGPMASVLRFARAMGSVCLAASEAHEGHWQRLESSREALGCDEAAFMDLCDLVPPLWHDWGRTLSIPTATVPPIREVAQRPVQEIRKPEAPQDRPRRSSRGGGSEGSYRILAVDDEDVSRRVLAFHLERAGHEVQVAASAEEALELAMKTMPEIVIADQTMPGDSGIDLCRALRRFEEGNAIYFILLAGRDEEDSVVAAFDAGADDYLLKPLKPRILLARVKAGQRLIHLQRTVEENKKRVQEQVAALGIANRKLDRASLTDPLTELPNRRAAMQTLKKEWAAAQRDGSSLALIMMDIDHFKQVNDTYGHDAGDEVLRQTAGVFKKTLRASEEAFRVGGEEFLVVCRGTGLEGGRSCAERIRLAVEANRITWGEFDRNVTLSLGVADSQPTMDGPEDLMKAADLAVYEAKEGGRNRVVTAASGTGVKK